MSGARLSLWAAASLVCSLGCIPPLSLLGPVLGVVGLYQTRRGAGRTGRGLAIAGIALGTVLTLGWVSVGGWLQVSRFEPMRYGPQRVLAHGFAGDLEAFRAGFWGRGGTASDEDIRAFIGALRSRYGVLRTSRQDAVPEDTPYDRARPRILYILEFEERGPVKAEAVFVLHDDGRAWPVHKWEAIIVYDPDQGDLEYPPGSMTDTGEVQETAVDDG